MVLSITMSVYDSIFLTDMASQRFPCCRYRSEGIRSGHVPKRADVLAHPGRGRVHRSFEYFETSLFPPLPLGTTRMAKDRFVWVS